MKFKSLLVVLVAGLIYLPGMSFGIMPFTGRASDLQSTETPVANWGSVIGAGMQQGAEIANQNEQLRLLQLQRQELEMESARRAAEADQRERLRVLQRQKQELEMETLRRTTEVDTREMRRETSQIIRSGDDLLALQQKAKQGDAEAQSNLGQVYYNGEGVQQNYAEAVRWSRLAVAQGRAEAQNTLGVAYYKGKGVPQDHVEAMRLWRLSAEQKYAKAQFNLAYAYAQGEGVPQDLKESVKWLRLAAEQGQEESQHILGRAYRDGKGVPQDYVQAYAWYNVAAAQGSGVAEKERTLIMERMIPEQIAEGQKLSREYAEKFVKR